MTHSRLDREIKINQGASHLQFLIEPIRVSYRREVNVSVAGIKIDAKEGDISSIPRWLAKILMKEGAIEISDNHISAYISRALNRERIAKPHDLSGIDPDFYIRVNDYLQSLSDREKESLIVSMNSFVASRLEKIVKLASASPSSTEIREKLSSEEHQLYELVHDSSSAFKQKVLRIV